MDCGVTPHSSLVLRGGHGIKFRELYWLRVVANPVPAVCSVATKYDTFDNDIGLVTTTRAGINGHCWLA